MPSSRHFPESGYHNFMATQVSEEVLMNDALEEESEN